MTFKTNLDERVFDVFNFSPTTTGNYKSLAVKECSYLKSSPWHLST